MFALSASDWKRVREANARLSLVSDRIQALDSVKDEIARLIPAEGAVAFTMGSTATHLRVGSMAASGLDGRALWRNIDSLLDQQPTHFSGWNAQRPEPCQRNKALSVVDFLGWERLRQLPMFQRVVIPMKLHRHHQLRALSCEGPSMLAWVGLFREDPFRNSELALLQAVLPAIQLRLQVDLRLRQAPLALAAFTAALEAIAAPAFLVRAGGVVVEANSAGRTLLNADRAGTLDGLRASLARSPSAPARSITVRAEGVGDHFLCIWWAVRADVERRAAAFASRYGLTPRQKRVLEHVVRGLPNKVIAAQLGRAEVTIEVHVGALLAKTGCGNRSELAARFWAAEI